jgi:SNF2 family DNA or RNA helicase
MASALLKIVEEVDGRSLIICPKNLVEMWENYVETYDLSAKIVSLSRVESELPELRRYRTVLIDESHNLRNREGKRYRVIEDYIRSNDMARSKSNSSHVAFRASLVRAAVKMVSCSAEAPMEFWVPNLTMKSGKSS